MPFGERFDFDFEPVEKALRGRGQDGAPCERGAIPCNYRMAGIWKVCIRCGGCTYRRDPRDLKPDNA